MDKYLNTGIKTIISEFPPVKDILDKYQIGCTDCGVGTCLLKDIVEIHNLSPADETNLMEGIGRIIYPSGEFNLPEIERKIDKSNDEIKYSPPMKKLVDEHVLIKRLIALIPKITNYLKKSCVTDDDIINNCTDFIRNYADKYHHAKEEDILFGYFNEGHDIIDVMYEDHKKGRSLVKSILESQDSDKNIVINNLTEYGELLTEHIKKEDEILYPWMDRQFDMEQIGEIYSRFNEVDEKFGDLPVKYEELVNKLESKFEEVCHEL